MTIAYRHNTGAVRPRLFGMPEEWFYLLIGLALAPIFAATPLLELMGWYFRALAHEMGHTAAAWLTGVPAVPALGITAEAATMQGQQSLILAFFVWAAIVAVTHFKAQAPQRYIYLALASTILPVLCLSGLREGWHLLSGHLVELVLGGVFLGRALSGGFSSGYVERALYSVLGWTLIGHNLALTASLLASSDARESYAYSGSFGLENDYLLLAHWSGTSLEGWALLMTVAATAVAPIVIGLWILHHREAAQ